MLCIIAKFFGYLYTLYIIYKWIYLYNDIYVKNIIEKMPQLVPFFFLNQVIFTFVLFILMVYIISKYILPRFVRLFLSRIFISLL